jgi:hypothetical protein
MPSKYLRKSKKTNPYRKIVIAMEGIVSEPNYFCAIRDKYRTNRLEILPLSRKAQGESAPNHVIKNLNHYCRNHTCERGDEYWMVIDKDRWTEANLSIVAQQCASKGYHLALSNPCFELWLILHYLDIATLSDAIRQDLVSTSGTQSYWANMPVAGNSNRWEEMASLLPVAIQNGVKLDTAPNERWPNSLATRVHLLAQTILDEFKKTDEGKEIFG